MRGLLALACLAISLALAGCGAPAAPEASAGSGAAAGPATASAVEPSPPSPARLSLMISYSALVASQSPVWIAEDAGLYERYGLVATLVYISSASPRDSSALGRPSWTNSCPRPKDHVQS